MLVGLAIITTIVLNIHVKDLLNNETNWHKDSDSKIYYLDQNKQKLTGWHRINGHIYYFNDDGSLQETMKAIDVSKYQNDINWDSVYNEGIKLAMIRSSYGWMDYPKQVDPKLYQNIEGASKAGLKVGVYHFSYATNEEEAKQEAQYCLKAIQGCDIQLPVAYDIESDKHEGLSKEEVSNIAVTFCEEVKKAGYTPMIYSDVSFLENKFIPEKISSYDLWLAQYAPQCTYTENYLMWQYTKNGKVNGVKNNLDFNYYYFTDSIKKFRKTN